MRKEKEKEKGKTDEILEGGQKRREMKEGIGEK